MYNVRKISDANEELQPLKDQKVAAFLGATGSGKSSVINGIISGTETMMFDENKNVVPTRIIEYAGKL